MAASMSERIRSDLNDARRARDRLRVTLLTTVLSEVRNKEIELGRPARDEDVIDVVTRAVKRRHEAAEQMRAGGRTDLADKEEQEAELLGSYLPAPLTEDDVRALVREARASGADSLGAVMGSIMPRLRGRFDGKEANRIVREELGA